MSQAARTSIICESHLHAQTATAELRAAGVQIPPSLHLTNDAPKPPVVLR